MGMWIKYRAWGKNRFDALGGRGCCIPFILSHALSPTFRGPRPDPQRDVPLQSREEEYLGMEITSPYRRRMGWRRRRKSGPLYCPGFPTTEEGV